MALDSGSGSRGAADQGFGALRRGFWAGRLRVALGGGSGSTREEERRRRPEVGTTVALAKRRRR